MTNRRQSTVRLHVDDMDDDAKSSFRLIKERKPEATNGRALRMIEAVLTYVEANGIEYEGLWLDEGNEAICEEFTRMYLDEKVDVDVPSFNAKHPTLSIAQFPNIIRNYLIKYANPLIPASAYQSVNILAKSPNELTSETGVVLDIASEPPADSKKNSASGFRKGSAESTDRNVKKDQKKPSVDENAEPITSTTLKVEQARKIVAFLTPLDLAMLGRLIVHISALHNRACFNGLTWRKLGEAFSFLLRGFSYSNLNVIINLTAKTLEFFSTHIDSLLPPESLLLLGEACQSTVGNITVNDGSDYGSPAAAVVANIRQLQQKEHRKKKKNYIEFTWCNDLI